MELSNYLTYTECLDIEIDNYIGLTEKKLN